MLYRSRLLAVNGATVAFCVSPLDPSDLECPHGGRPSSTATLKSRQISSNADR